MTQPPDRRRRRRRATIDEIKTTAREQMAADGAASLSLGAIARAMGVTTPALYRYFKSRDALVASLIADAYDSMAEALEQAVGEQEPEDYAGRFFALMRGYRQWAVAHAAEYALMFGASLESPDLPAATIGRATMRNLRVMVQLFRVAQAAERLVIPQPYHTPTPALRQALVAMRSALGDEEIPLEILALSFAIWLPAHGLVWEELHGHLPKFLFASGELYEMEIGVMAERLGLAPERD
jgi:AcrR family transcriptional regulator